MERVKWARARFRPVGSGAALAEAVAKRVGVEVRATAAWLETALDAVDAATPHPKCGCCCATRSTSEIGEKALKDVTERRPVIVLAVNDPGLRGMKL